MSLYKRGDTWWISYADGNGGRIQRSSGSKDKKQAQELHDKLLAERWRVGQLGAKPRRSWQEAAVRWCNERKDKKSIQTDIEHFRLLDGYLGKLGLDEVTADVIDFFKRARLNQGVSNSTINRSLALVRALLNAAVKEWEWLDSAPHVKLLKVPPGRVRWLEPDEIARLADELPKHLRDMMLFTIYTGLRESNVTQLRWKNVSFERACLWVDAENSKNGKPIAVSLNEQALALLLPLNTGKSPYVFTYKGKPVTRANNHAWRKALERAGIDDFRWHDLRHAWATNHVRNGTPIDALKVLGGWESRTMAERYAHLGAADVSQYAVNASKGLKIVP